MLKQKRHLYKNEYVILFVFTNILFLFLYHRFIFGEYAYVFTDVGADTLQINYAQYGLFASLFKSGNIDSYSLSAGLGMDLSSYWPAYLIPYNFIILITPAKWLPWAVLASTYFKIFTISIVGYLFFKKKIGKGAGAMSAAFAWTFSGYVIVWGQHYGFCTCMALFTIFMYFLQCYLDEDVKWKNIGLVISVTLLLFSSYYFLYMIAAFSVFYMIVTAVINRMKLKKFFRKIVGLGLMGVLGVFIGGIALMPVMDTFLESARADVLTKSSSINLWRPYNIKKIGNFVARFFSSNLLGAGSEYTGMLNYYEAAVLSVSLLTIFAVCYFIIKKSTRFRTLILAAVSIILLIMPLTSRILVFTAEAHRWTFMICFGEAIVIEYFIHDIATECDRMRISITAVASAVLFAAGMLFIHSCAKKGYYEINVKVCICVCGFFMLYAAVLVIGSWVQRLKCFMIPALFLLLVGELTILNYPSLNWREVPTRSQLATEYYNDGTKEAIDYIEQTDDGVYRVDKTYESASENDGMGQGYKGLSVYMSTNSASLVNYHKLYGKDTVSVNFVDFNNDNYLQSALMGAKYLLTNAGCNPSSSVYTYIGNKGGKEIYSNNYSLPFGYLYDSSWEECDVENMTGLERTLAGLSGFYYTDKKDVNTYKKESMPDGNEKSLIQEPDEANDCSVNVGTKGIQLSDMTDDPNIVFDNMSTLFSDENKIYGFSMTVKADKDISMSVYYQVEGDDGFSQEKICIFPISKNENTWEYVLPGGITKLRVDVNTPVTVDSLTIEDFSIKSYDCDEVGYTALKESKVDNISFSKSRYTAQVTNDSENSEMLCVPIFYQKGWKAKLDGEYVNVNSINGGLVGIEIPEGEHQLTIKYSTPYMSVGICLTIVGLMITVIYLFVSRNNKHISSEIL